MTEKVIIVKNVFYIFVFHVGRISCWNHPSTDQAKWLPLQEALPLYGNITILLYDVKHHMV